MKTTDYLHVTGPIRCVHCEYRTDEKLPYDEQSQIFIGHVRAFHSFHLLSLSDDLGDALTREALRSTPPLINVEIW